MENKAQRTGELDFPVARAQIESGLEAFLKGGTQIQVPAFTFEKGETKFAFPVTRLDKALVVDALALIKTHIENVRIHTFEPGYVIFQDMGPNLFQPASPSETIKFKLISIAASHRVEITRRGNLNQDELLACINLFRLFHPKERVSDPAARLAELGGQVYVRSEDPGGAPPTLTTQTAAESGSSPAETGTDETVDTPRNGFTYKHGFAGYKKTKQEVLENVILPLRHPEIFQSVARMTRASTKGTIPRAVLFEGPPGVGKTTMARIIAIETGMPMVYVPVENILSKYYGESAQNMAAIFDTAAQYERVILFLDEIDSLAGSREDGLFEATRRVLSVLLRKIDGFDTRDGVLTIGATNRSQDLDGALLSRFDTVIRFPLPNLSERAGIFRRYAHQLSSEELEQVARLSEGLSGRSIQDICEYAERRWARMLIAEGRSASAPPGGLYLEMTREKCQQPGPS